MTENSPEVIPNGYSLADTLKAADNETRLSPIASNGTSSHIDSQVSENSEMIGYQELLPHMERDTKVANTVRQNGEATLATFTGPLFSENRTESRQQGMVRGVENDARVANTVRQNGETARKAQEQSLSAVRREQETQIRTLHIDDDGDEDNVAAAENGQVRTEHQASGARVFALNRPHAWHQELSKKRHEAAVDDPVIDRQVPS